MAAEADRDQRAAGPAGDLFALAPDLLFVAAAGGELLRANPAWERGLGWSAAELRARPLSALAHPDDAAALADGLRRCRERPGGGDFEVRLRARDGGFRRLAFRAAPGPGGELHGGARDVTEQRRAEEELQRERAFVRQVLDASPSLIFVKDEAGRFLLVNRATAELFGTTPEELVQRSNAELHQQPEVHSHQLADRQVIRERQAVEAEETFTLPDGEVRVYQTIRTPLLRGSGEVMVLGISTEITARKRAEEELIRAREEALAASRAKSQFLANMSHEIRTPMNGVLGMTALALETELTQEQRDYLAAVQTSGRNLLAIINDILDLSKIEAQRMELEQVPFELSRSIEETLRAQAPRTEEKGLELLMQVAPEVPWTVIGDPVRFRQVLTNLVGNAIKFTEKGEITVRAALESGSAREEGLLRVSVQDTGAGIRAERQEAIFDAFTQEDGSTTRRFGGTGLGLTISRELVRQMGGRIWVESEPGQGSTFAFTVRLPPAATAGEVPRPDLRRLRAWVVDDNRKSREMLLDAFRNWNADGRGFASAEEAAAELHRAQLAGAAPRLLVVDHALGGLDGLNLCREVETDPRTQRIARVLLLPPGRRIPRELLEQAGVARAIFKPVSEPVLLEVVQQALAGWLTKRPPVSAASLQQLSAFIPPSDPALQAAGAHPQPPRAAPLAPPVLAAAPKPDGPPPPPRLALLAEDNDINALLARKMLERLGWKVERVASGAAAVERAEQGGFDAVLMDVQMPLMDGYEATRRIRAHEAASGGHVPIIALTANAMKGDEEACRAAGMDLYVAKPIHLDELRLALESAAGMGTGRAPA